MNELPWNELTPGDLIGQLGVGTAADAKRQATLLTEEINADAAEVARLREARRQARAGQRKPWREAMPPIDDVEADTRHWLG